MSTTYKIASGDNLTKIAKANNTTVAALMAANPQITNANVIQAGATLNIPSTSQQGGSYTYQNKSYAIGTGPYPSGQVPATSTPQTIYNTPSMATQPYQTPQTSTGSGSNAGGASGTGSGGTGTGGGSGSGGGNSGSSGSGGGAGGGTGTGSGAGSSGTGSSTTTTPVLDQSTIDSLHFLGFTDAQIAGMSAGDQANWAMTGTYLKKQSDLAATTASINAQTFNDAYTKAVNDPNIAAKYADLATTTAGDFANNLSQISLNAQLTSQQQQAQMQQAQAAQEKQFGGAGTAYSSFRQGAQQQLNTSNQGVIQSTASQIQQQLRTAGAGAEQLYGSNYAPLQNAGVQYLNPLTGQSQNIGYQGYGNLTGTVGQQKEADVLARQQQIYQATVPPAAPTTQY